ncbi:LacI family transcriptional regulator [Christensenellaceae bacterium OttesenSCG-928-L17]|nr:LacI family transcriptional regulator [Christensenellaceae bacterium OttesenSCG-928-L17]
MRNVTIKDIARIANVSYATVSRALSGSTEINSETRKRILQICEEVGYTPNDIARSMVARQTHLLGLIVSNINNPFMAELAYHIEAHARKLGYSIMLCNSSQSGDLEKNVYSLLLGRQVDGILIVPAFADTYRTLEPLLGKTPTVFISENLRDLPESYVSVDNYQGTRLGMEHLYSLGHRNILYFGRRKRSATHALRAKGYLDACKQFGLTPQVFENRFSASSIQNGYQLAMELFAQELPYTAIFAAADTLALGVMQAADECGIAIPQQLSLMGFDNIRYCELPKINLTTIEQPIPMMAVAAVEMLIEKIDNKAAGYSHRVLTPSLIVRNTTKPPEKAEISGYSGHMANAIKNL